MPIAKNLRSGARELLVPPTGQLPALDVLRSLAVLMVVGGHFADAAQVPFPSFKAWFSTPVFRFGWTGVDLFFVLSGFLIGRQLWKELVSDGTIRYGRFILRRGFRIWPLYLVFVVLSPYLSGTGHYLASDWLFFSNYRWGNVGGGWSLSTEEQFYLLAPLAVLALARWAKPKVWLYVIPLLVVAVSVARLITANAMFHKGLSVSVVKTALYSPFHLRNEGLLIGLFLALVSVLRPELIFRRDETPVWRVSAAAAVLVVLGLALRTINNVVFPFLGLALVFGGAMVLLLMCRGKMRRVMQARPFYLASRLSYGVYLNHFAVLRWVVPPVAVLLIRYFGSSSLAVTLTFVATLSLSLALSAALYLIIERPFLRARDSILALTAKSPSDSVRPGAPIRPSVV